MPSTQTYVQPEWLTISEAAEIVGVHVDTLRRWDAAGRIPAARTPTGHRRFRRSDVEALLVTTAARGGQQVAS